MKRKHIIRVMLLLAGLGIIVVALFAYQIGLDNDAGWGRGRWLILAAGVVTALFGASDWILAYLYRLPWFGGIRFLVEPDNEGVNSQQPVKGGGGVSDFILAILFIGAVLFYGWVITVGRFDRFPPGKDYYGLLTQAFQHGQAHLLAEPELELLQLENPYDYEQRKNVPHLWDITLYDGKYFLYWGPAPAVLGVIFSSVTLQPVTDSGLVFALVVGTALFSVLLLRRISIDAGLPAWLYWGGVVSLLVNIPLIWMLTRPKYYEVATAGGLCFMVMGFYFFHLAFRSGVARNIHLILASLSLGLAAASRMSLIPGIALLAALMAWKIYVQRKGQGPTAIVTSWLAAALPLALAAVSMAWYNFIRFGSIFEFGFTYTLTGPTLSPLAADVFSPRYALANLYTYFFRPPSIGAEFPFVRLDWIREEMWPVFLRLPEGYYYTDPVAGVFLMVPVTGLTVLFSVRSIWRWLNGDLSMSVHHPIGLLLVALAGYFVLQSGVLVVFAASNIRYLVDIAQELVLLAVVFSGVYLPVFAVNRFQKRTVAILWWLAVLATLGMGLLIGLTGDRNLFLNQNPQLYYQLAEWFSR